ncbi:M1 family metallopeptidase [Sporichthya sp.]|uniref:M1 family metallopeptidase n=1 Tax=Sporichthya sp. TaxID=65475 RepID=UPI0017D98F95|nr:M1 family metallopeptidase [Sporichthya sp.]MBA3742686.1 M1 family metallopeptidase [Sporichthya sp.]
MRRSKLSSVLAGGLASLVLAALAVPGGAEADDTFVAGAAGVGDSYFPANGNGGYDVDNYDLAVRYDPLPGMLGGVATVTAKATQDLARFNLDLVGLTVREVTVDGAAARFTRAGQELEITPAAGVTKGRNFTVVVRYDGIPDPLLSGSEARGFFRTLTGAVFVGQPFAATAWYPVNDHPRDRATYTVAVDVPAGLTGVSNGALVDQRSAGNRTVFTWRSDDAMASYLSTLAVGDFDLKAYSRNGVRYWDAVDRILGPGYARAALDQQPMVLDTLASMFGPYPFDIGGAIVHSADAQFALETQTRPVYSPKFFAEGGAGVGVIVHELAHQWFGDNLRLADWRNIWINEGFATYAQWLFNERTGAQSADAAFTKAWADYADDAEFWAVRIGDPGAQNIFNGAVYVRGAMTLHQLRRVVGDKTFFKVIRSWATSRAGTAVTIEEFITHAETVSGRDLGQFFDVWLFTGVKPTLPGPGGPAAL